MTSQDRGGEPDRARVEAAIRGEADAVRALWQESRRWVAGILLAHKPREADLEDLLQDVAMAYVRTIGGLRDGGVFRPWLRTISINTARLAGRETTRRRRLAGVFNGGAREAEPAAVRSGEEPAGHAATTDQARRVMDLAQRLPEGYREPLLLKCLRGMSYKQIGELLGLPDTTIETRIARARRMLRELAAGVGVAPASLPAKG